MARKLNTVDEIIEALGGAAAAAERYGVGVTAVLNWKAREELPAKYYASMQHDLAVRGVWASSVLWGQVQVA